MQHEHVKQKKNFWLGRFSGFNKIKVARGRGSQVENKIPVTDRCTSCRVSAVDKCIVIFFSAGRTYASFQGKDYFFFCLDVLMHRFKALRKRSGGGGGLLMITSTACSTACRKANVAGAFRPGDRTESTVTCEQLVSLEQIDKAFFWIKNRNE